MGAGNFYLENAETAYVEHTLVYGDWNGHGYDLIEHDSDYSWCFDEFVRVVRSCLPASFCEADDATHYGRTGGTVIAENDFYQVTVIDWESYFAVNVVLKESRDCRWDFNPLAVANLTKNAKLIFDCLHSKYPLRVRCGAWTSGFYSPSCLLA